MSAEVFKMVLEELVCRKLLDLRRNGICYIAGTIHCEYCGNMYGSKVWHANSKYHRVIWPCNAKFKNEHHCTTPHLTETIIQEMFPNAFNLLINHRDCIAKDIKIIVGCLTGTKSLKSETVGLCSEMEIVTELIKQAILQNASMVLDQDEYTA